jgi:hypothetical protein
LFVFFVLFRRRSLAMRAMILGSDGAVRRRHAAGARQHPADHFAPSLADVALFVAVQTAFVLAAVRFGLLTMLVAQCVSVLLTVLPIAIDSSSLRLIVRLIVRR